MRVVGEDDAAHVAGGGTDVEEGEGLGGAEQAAEGFAENLVAAGETIDALEIAEARCGFSGWGIVEPLLAYDAAAQVRHAKQIVLRRRSL